ncbi:MAG TPA: hypothetical protein VGO09_04165 [Flavisolibacter sp.]|nr:hypothetical protein [Flavisolibacter sp.]
MNNANVVSGIQMSVQIAGFHPGDKVPVTYVRNGKEFNTSVILKKKTDVVNNNIGTRLGGDLSTLDNSKASRYGISGGVVVNKIFDGSVLKNARIQPGFIITSVITSDGEQEIKTVEDLTNILSNLTGTVRIQGIYPGYSEPYTYPLNLE